MHFFTCNNFEVDEKSGVDDGRIQLLPFGQVQVGEIRVGLQQPVRTCPQLLRHGVLVVDPRAICAWWNELQMYKILKGPHTDSEFMNVQFR
jgi:hypothetical protein